MTTGRLELYMGPMFSGKSTILIKNIRLFKIINKKILILKPCIDTRYELNKIVSHNGEKEDCFVTDDLINISNEIIINYDIIIIDEAQFFKSLKKSCLLWIEKYNKHVIVGGLDSDYKRNPIGEILDLIPYADKYYKLYAICKCCNDGTKALFSKRIKNKNNKDNKDNTDNQDNNNNQDNQILIGGDELYISVCRYHYITDL